MGRDIHFCECGEKIFDTMEQCRLCDEQDARDVAYVKRARRHRGPFEPLRKVLAELHLSENAPESDEVSGYSKSSGLCNSIIKACVIFFFLILPILIGIICAFSAYSNITVPPKEEYVIQSAFIEVIP